MTSELTAMLLAFAATVGVAFLLYGLLTLFRREDADSTDPRPVPRVLGPLTSPLATLCPAVGSSRETIRKDLLRAGYFEPVAFLNFQCIRSLLLYLPLLGGLYGGIFHEGLLGVLYIGCGFVLAILGYAIPRVILSIQADVRTEQIRRGLPTLMDTLGLTLTTGSSLPWALRRAGESVRRGFPELAREVRIVVAQIPLRSVSHALDQWRQRQPISELGSLAFLIGQGDRLGSDITRGLWELSQSLQISARQRAEAAANRANFFMLFPTVLCLLLAAGLSLAGPALVKLLDSGREMDRLMQETQQAEEKIRQEQKSPRLLSPGAAQPQPQQPPRDARPEL